MIFIKLDNLETVNKLVSICTKYKEHADVDIVYGRYTLDGCSVLGVTSLIGNIVKIIPVLDDVIVLDSFISEVKKIGAWVEKH